MIGAACCQLLHVGGEQDPGDVLIVGVEVGDGEELRAVKVLDELPDEDIALELRVSSIATSELRPRSS